MISSVQDYIDVDLIGSATGLMLSIAMMSATAAPTVAGFMITNYGFNLALILTIAMPQLAYIILAFKATGARAQNLP